MKKKKKDEGLPAEENQNNNKKANRKPKPTKQIKTQRILFIYQLTTG